MPFFETVDELMAPVKLEVLDLHLKTLKRGNALAEVFGRLAEVPAVQRETFHACSTYGLRRHASREAAVLPFMFNRVQLGDPRCDHLNASYLKPGPRRSKGLIAAESPTEQSCVSFLEMLFEHKISLVLMLENVAECGQSRCWRYWPEGVRSRVTHGDMDVELLSERPASGYRIRLLQITRRRYLHPDETQSQLLVTQLQFVAWPAAGMPQPRTFLHFFHDACERIERQSSEFPLAVVHCSNGAERTGVFVVLQRLRWDVCVAHRATMDVVGVVRETRKYRQGVVVCCQQLLFIYEFMRAFMYEFADLAKAVGPQHRCGVAALHWPVRM